VTHNTALAMNMAEKIAIEGGCPVGVFSLEMSSEQLVQRMVLSRAGVSHTRVKKGYATSEDFHKISVAAQAIHRAPIYIDDTSALAITNLGAIARRWKRRFGIRVIFIDYLQLLKSNTKRGRENRQVEVAEISAMIKSLAKELSIPIVVLAQLNRNPDKHRTSSKPRLSDLRESGSIEQDADVVGLVHRSEYYAESDEDKKEEAGKASLIIAKQRNGPTGESLLTFIKEFTRFEDRSKDTPQKEAQKSFHEND